MMLKKIILGTAAAVLGLGLLSSYSCKSDKVGQAGSLPAKWWLKNRGELQNAYRASAKGAEGQVMLFIGFSDAGTNIDMNTAIENASLDAKVQLSSYLSQKVTAITQSGKHIKAIDDAEKNGSMKKQDCEKLKRKVEEKMATYKAAITSTQFSSFKMEAQHTEKQGQKYAGWVCYSMSDQVLAETKKLQEAAFATLMAETEEYKEIMKTIQSVVAQKMLETLMDEAGLDAKETK